MATDDRVTEIRSIPVVVYTPSTRSEGILRSNHFRFSDAMNTVNQDFVRLHDVTIQPLHAAKGETILAASMLIRNDNVAIAMPQEGQAGHERSPIRQSLQVQRVPVRAIVEAWPFTIQGTLHLPPSVDLLQHVHDPHHPHMPVTDASVLYQPSPLLSFKAPFLLVNRQKIEVVVDLSTVGQTAEAQPGPASAKVVETELSGARAAHLLATTSVFKTVDLTLLQQVWTELCANRQVSRKLCKAGAEVFHQRDLGDTLYVVEEGTLDVLVTDRWGADHHLASFGPGDFFGEMAVLGDGRRTATVRAVTAASLMAIHDEAVKGLLRRFPSATTTMLKVMVQRQVGLNVHR
ncbi:MAG: cyclic nucleotide-binding domain-containing protein [Chloroflexi bacterium]|nr:cyclic nucleotide-binding domain-containing protein [Chloroflexota bacterium]